MHDLTCSSCGTPVLVEKFSPTHTSVQWLRETTSACPELARAADRGRDVTRIPSCAKLRDSIDAAVREGRIATNDLRHEPTPGTLN